MQATIVIRELSSIDRTLLERHLLALEAGDRYLRFGHALRDEAVREYVARIDFGRDAGFGVFDDELRLVGAAHLARGAAHAELGVSVVFGARGRGVGGALLARANLHARNWGVRRLFMHCLTENAAMMRLARRQGMAIDAETGEADAWLALPPANAASHFGEVFEEHAARFDYVLKAQLVAARRLAAILTPGTT